MSNICYAAGCKYTRLLGDNKSLSLLEREESALKETWSLRGRSSYATESASSRHALLKTRITHQCGGVHLGQWLFSSTLHQSRPKTAPSKGVVTMSSQYITEEDFDRADSHGKKYLKLELHHFTSKTKWIASFLRTLSGIFCAYAIKIMCKQHVASCADSDDPACAPTPYTAPYTQTLVMLTAEASCLIIYGFDKIYNLTRSKVPYTDFAPSHEQYLKKRGRWYHWIPAGLADAFGTVLFNIAMSFTYATTVVMLKNFMVVISAVLQLFMIRRALRIHEWIGVTCITTALVLTAIPAVLHPDPDVKEPWKATLGIALAILGTSLHGLQGTLEEFNFKKTRYSCLRAVGMEGLTGGVIWMLLYPIFSYTNFENVKVTRFQLKTSSTLQQVMTTYFFSTIIYNAAGIATTALGGGLLRSIVTSMRSPIVWVIDLSLGWLAFDLFNLWAAFVFFVGFIIHVRMYPREKCTKLHKFLSTPIHSPCTRREFDEDYVPIEDADVFIA
eukprot:Blabericola_migrator_1__2593@NODE_1731_length_3907_cov_108_722917_g1118_i0_p1_GENE_NODE_1731_length_3907_cov_108_722917_g1118_i0NODE_1731_length_3907_cov_108_722917_g1118_i0_p1_ORF_typecomplete_len501_score59_02SLC35F/PF06027_12/2_5e24CRTlike/PF08627_10/1_8e20CRTlike/PF08627_10/7_6e02Nuc_sug_transp/PF04142_15/2_2e02Nuc_sug_transp/PF04142_15/3_2e19UAA/PF08449_11/4_9e12PUNUT/PF16913_5/2_9e02PUNUT/PF16913_5/1_4e08EamA/PF00892_20/1_5e07EamA/PF00892_20/1_8e04TPT/PF03151_16/4_3e07Mg_trans_NIPA/PF05653